MRDEEVRLIIGGLLHDIGKVIYRQGGDRRNHSQSGYDYLREEAEIRDEEILNCVQFHHYDQLKHAKILQNDKAYIVYMADNVASAADRRKNDTEERGFEPTLPLQSVFNILNGNQENLFYKPAQLNPKGEINYPQTEKIPFSELFYTEIKQKITENLKGMFLNQEYINSFLEVMEGTLSFVPSSTSKGELADISLFDHMKLTAAVASCIHAYLAEKGIENYKEVLFDRGASFYETEAFLLCSMDISGIQDFIYTISSKNALRTLRARSFYLEIMMEHIIDSLLEKMNLSRANLIYSGGGHCYLLLPNTEWAKKTVDDFLSQTNHWFLKHFQTTLYIAGGYASCSSNTLKNMPVGSYAELFRKVGSSISQKKSTRYQADDILWLNERRETDYSRECKVCKNIGQTDEEGVCQLCRQIEWFSQKILYQDFFTILLENGEQGLPLPGSYLLVSDSKESVKRRMENDPFFVRTYSKNEMYTGRHVATKLWVGDYTTGQSFQELAEEAEGISRIGILRADVDNLGHAFVSGFRNEKNQDRYATLSRSATFSRQLSLFFKLYINQILRKQEFRLGDRNAVRERKATIVYSGGDDVFIVGAWDQVIELAIDLYEKFKQYTQNTLTISGGIGIYPPSYPISAIAGEVEEMEGKSKKLQGKCGITLLEDGQVHDSISEGNIIYISDGTYSWQEFIEQVIGEKFKVIQEFFECSEDRGMAFLYRLLELIRSQAEKINFARYVYLLSRMEPKEDEEEKRKAYQKFSQNMYRWIKSERDCRQLKTAITLYVYWSREKGEKNSYDFE